jgi:hypothetical protein
MKYKLAKLSDHQPLFNNKLLIIQRYQLHLHLHKFHPAVFGFAFRRAVGGNGLALAMAGRT